MTAPSFYVYAYLRSKTSLNGPAGSPYYIGKGSGSRAWSKSRNETRPPKNKGLVLILHSQLTEERASLSKSV